MSNELLKPLEEKIAFLEHHVTQQDKAMLEMTEAIARLRVELRALRQRLSDDPGSAPARESADLPDERPPHY